MIRNYFFAAYRIFSKEKLSGTISLLGHAVGMACCILIWIYINDELSYNKQNKDLTHIYRINWITKQDGKTTIEATAPTPLAPSFEGKLAGVRAISRMYVRSGEMQTGNPNSKVPASDLNRFHENDVYFADQSVFQTFTINFIGGGLKTTSLNVPGNVVITDEMAHKYFGNENALGKTLWYENKLLLQVTGVVKKMPANSDIRFDFLVSFESLFSAENKAIADFLRNDWSYNPSYTYVVFKPGQEVNAINIQLNSLLKTYGNVRNKQLNSITLQPLKDIHLYASNVDGNQSTSSIAYVYIFSIIALLILFIANVNFINLSIARAAIRTMEIGMRKVLGAGKKQLVLQVLGENMVVSIAAFFLAAILSWLALPVLNQLTEKQLGWNSLFNFTNALIFIVFFLVIGLLAGLYPAFFITRFKPAEALKGKSGTTNQKHFVRKVLLTIQFVISMVLIIGAVVVYQQLNYLQNKPLGFKKHEVIVVPIFGSGDNGIGYGVDGPMRQRINLFEETLSKFNRVKGITAASSMPGNGFVRGLVIPQGRAGTDNIFVPWISVDYNFLDVLNIPLAAGRTFSKATGTDHLGAFILNESAVRSFGWKNDDAAIGKNIIRGEETNGKKGQVIGVIKDFDFNSFDRPMEPMIMDVNAPRFSQFAISVEPGHINETIGLIRKTWNDLFPERVFEFSFLDKQIDALYKDKENLGRLIGYFSLIAILLSCAGLFSLASFLSLQRTREIAIRKVLGATISNIMLLLSWDFIKIVFIAFILAAPIAAFALYKWLDNFAYRISVPWWVFILTVILVATIAFLTVSVQSIKVALTNPVKNLRSE